MNRYNKRMAKLEVETEALQSRLNEIEEIKRKISFPRWTEKLLRPVLNEIKKQLPGYKCDSRLIPMGLGCRVSVFFFKKGLPKDADRWQEDNSIYMAFLPGKLSEGELLYETGEKSTRFAPDTIGEINGFNQLTKPLETIEEAVGFLNAQSQHKPSQN